MPGRADVNGRVGAAVIAAAALSFVVACSASRVTATMSATLATESAPVRLGVSFDLLNQIRRAELDAIRVAAQTRNASVTFVVANNDAATQESQIHDLLAHHEVDALLVIAQDRDRILTSIREANRAHVPVIAVDRAPAPGGTISFQITGSPVDDGRMAGSFLVGMHKRMHVLHLWGALNDDNALGRRDGFNAAAAGTDVHVVAQAPTNWNPDTAAAATTSALATHPDINAIFVPSDFLLPSVSSALTHAGRNKPAGQAGHITVVTIDGDQVGCQALRSGLIDADVATLVGEFGEQAVAAAVRAVGPRPGPPTTVKVPGLLLSRQNFADESRAVWGCATG